MPKGAALGAVVKVRKRFFQPHLMILKPILSFRWYRRSIRAAPQKQLFALIVIAFLLFFLVNNRLKITFNNSESGQLACLALQPRQN